MTSFGHSRLVLGLFGLLLGLAAQAAVVVAQGDRGRSKVGDARSHAYLRTRELWQFLSH